MPTLTFQNLPVLKKNRIFEAITSEIIQHGVDHFKIAPIVRESEIPRGSFYQYFENKKDVFDYVINEIGLKKKQFYQQKKEQLSLNNVSFYDQLKTTLYWGLEFATHFPEYQALWHQLFLSKSELLTPWINQSKANAHKIYVDWLKADLELGRINPFLDVELTASIFVTLTTDSLLSDFLDKSLKHDLLLKKIDGLLYLIRFGLEKRNSINEKTD